MLPERSPSAHSRTCCSLNPQLYNQGGLNGYPCGAETVMDQWLNLPSVQAALHVQTNNKGMVYRRTAGNLLPLYSQLIQKYRVLIYSGDTDACVPYWGTEEVQCMHCVCECVVKVM